MFPASLRALVALGLPVFTGRYNLNVILWRAPSRTPGLMDDGLSVVYQTGEGDTWREDFWPVNIDPSPRYLLDPINPKGTLVIPAGHHKGAWKLGLHRGRNALVQASALSFGRDTNKDLVLNPTVKDQGVFGWNLHNGGADDSAGCVTTGEGAPGQWVVDTVRVLLSRQSAAGYGSTVSVSVVEL